MKDHGGRIEVIIKTCKDGRQSKKRFNELDEEQCKVTSSGIKTENRALLQRCLCFRLFYVRHQVIYCCRAGISFEDNVFLALPDG